MPDQKLRDTYLRRLNDTLPLPDAERAATVEEIAAHVEMASGALVERGLPAEIAERRVLERLGALERLADDIAASHRQPSHVLAAAGTALRVTLATSFQALVLAWAGVIVLALALGLAVAAIRRLVGAGFLQADWSPLLDGLLPAVVGGLVAYAVGRAIVKPVARAARRHPAQVRLPILIIGVCVLAFIGLTAIEARWTPWTAGLMASLPAWFALGVHRPGLLPGRLPRGLSVITLIGLLVIGTGAMLFMGGNAAISGGSTHTRAYDPNEEYARVGSFVSLDHPPVELDPTDSSAGPWEGTGPVRVNRAGTIRPGILDGWTSVRLEAWPGWDGENDGPALDPAAMEPLATTPMVINGRRVSGELRFAPLVDRANYYVAVTGLDADGKRWQLSAPGFEFWRWRGTPLELIESAWR